MAQPHECSNMLHVMQKKLASTSFTVADAIVCRLIIAAIGLRLRFVPKTASLRAFLGTWATLAEMSSGLHHFGKRVHLI